MPINNGVTNQKGTPAFYSDTFANRPAFGYAGRVFISTDSGQIFEDTGTAWTLIADAGVGGGTLSSVCLNGNTTASGIVITANGLTANSIIKSGGTSSQFLKADGSVDSNTYLQNGGYLNGQVLFGTTGGNPGGSTSFLWDNTLGRLFVGVFFPSTATLQIGGTAEINGNLTANIGILNQVKSVGSGGISFNANGGTQIALMGAGGGANMTLYGGLTGTSANFSGNLTIDTNTLFVDSTNNSVGIGTITPSDVLDVQKNQNAITNFYLRNTDTTNASSRAYLNLISGTTSLVFKALNADHSFIDASSDLYFQSAGSVKMIIRNSGNIGIGTSVPTFQLQLSTDSAAKPTTALWTIASDQRIKENISPYTKGLEELLKINPIIYDYNGLGGFKKGKGGVGIIAQEIMKILPDSVNSVKLKLYETDEQESDILNFNGQELIYILINSIKEQQTQIEELKLLINK